MYFMSPMWKNTGLRGPSPSSGAGNHFYFILPYYDRRHQEILEKPENRGSNVTITPNNLFFVLQGRYDFIPKTLIFSFFFNFLIWILFALLMNSWCPEVQKTKYFYEIKQDFFFQSSDFFWKKKLVMKKYYNFSFTWFYQIWYSLLKHSLGPY